MKARRLLPLLLLCLAALPVAAVELRLKREATLAGDVVRLGMVAEIHGAGERRDWWANLELTRLAPDRERLVLDQQAVARVLRARTDLPFSLTGSRVTVHAATFLLGRDELVHLVREEITRRWPDRVMEVVFIEVPADLRLRGERAELRCDFPGDGLPSGPFEVGVLVCREGLDPLRLAVVCRVTVAGRVAVARRVLPAGATVRAGDFELVARDEAPRRALADPLGRRLVKAVPRGAVLDETLFEKPILVRRGDRLLVTVGEGGVVVEAPLEALTAAREDDLIDCRNPLTGALLRVRVTGPGSAALEAAR